MNGPASFSLRPLTADDAPDYNDFFAEGTRAHPDTLRITQGDIAAQPFATAPSDDAATFAAVDGDGTWLGVVTVERERGREKRRHIAWVVRMYVAADRAGKGVGRALLQTAIARARQMPGVSKVNLTVAAHNDRAIALYESAGFVAFARETDAFRHGERRIDELSMALPL